MLLFIYLESKTIDSKRTPNFITLESGDLFVRFGFKFSVYLGPYTFNLHLVSFQIERNIFENLR